MNASWDHICHHIIITFHHDNFLNSRYLCSWISHTTEATICYEVAMRQNLFSKTPLQFISIWTWELIKPNKNSREMTVLIKCFHPGKSLLRGRGVFDLGKVKIEFNVVSERGECQLPDAFYWTKNIVPIEFWNLEFIR